MDRPGKRQGPEATALSRSFSPLTAVPIFLNPGGTPRGHNVTSRLHAFLVTNRITQEVTMPNIRNEGNPPALAPRDQVACREMSTAGIVDARPSGLVVNVVPFL